MQSITSWGRLSAEPHQCHAFRDITQLQQRIQPGGIAFGLGRSYGDVCLNPQGLLWNMHQLDRFIEFDSHHGILRCEAGVSLKAIQNMLLPKGWSLPVTPGTLWVTVGGAIANDIHGKNHHHMGTFGEHVRSLRLLRSSGEVMDCSPTLHPAYFAATIGGLGLTGVITEVELNLRRVPGAFLETETLLFSGLNDFFELSAGSEEWEYTVAWLDCTHASRGLFMRANWFSTSDDHLSPCKRTWTFPFTPPVSLVNRHSLKALNQLYFHTRKRHAKAVMHHEAFLYPLDRIKDWHRAYGAAGFFQYQCLLPPSTALDALTEMLAEIRGSKTGSSLLVLKNFGARESCGMMRFVSPGVTFALDFPNEGLQTLRLFERLDKIVMQAKGRLYLAKDARMSVEMFERGYPELEPFLTYRDPGMTSALSRRLIGR